MEVIHFTQEAFEKAIAQTAKPVLVDFWATWCGPCRMLGPIIEEIAAENDELIVGKVNVDDNQELAMRYGIDTIPAVLLFRNGNLDRQAIGYMDKATLLATLGL